MKHGDIVYKVWNAFDKYCLYIGKVYEGPSGFYIHPNTETGSNDGWHLTEFEAFQDARKLLTERLNKQIKLIDELEQKEKGNKCV